MTADPAHYTLYQLTKKIKEVVSGAFDQQLFWVVADISNHSYQHQKGFHFFDLVEKDDKTRSLKARIGTSAWGAGALKIEEFERSTGQKFKNDLQILCRVGVEFHPLYGLKLVLMDLDVHFTLGALEQQKRQTLARLLAECPTYIRLEGEEYRTRNQELHLPRVLQRIAVISSRNSAGYQDFEHTLEHNAFGYRFILDPYYALVQGEENALQIRNLLLEIYRSGKPYDAILILRGGGATTDFLIFETFLLGQIVAKYPIPIITGIGHQKNETIVDLMAHTATKTPTKAAEFLIAHTRRFEQAIAQFQHTITIRTQQHLSQEFKTLHQVQSILVNRSRTLIHEQSRQILHKKNRVIQSALDALAVRGHENGKLVQTLSAGVRYTVSNHMAGCSRLFSHLKFFSGQLVSTQKQALLHYASLVRVMSPQHILKRGFAFIKRNGEILNTSSTLVAGDTFEVETYLEDLTVLLKSIKYKDGRQANL